MVTPTPQLIDAVAKSCGNAEVVEKLLAGALAACALAEAKWWANEPHDSCYYCCNCEASMCLHSHRKCVKCLRLAALERAAEGK